MSDIETILNAAHKTFYDAHYERDHFTAFLGKGDGSSTIVNSTNTAAREVFYYEKNGSAIIATGVAVLGDNCGIPYENSATWVDRAIRLARRPGETRFTVVGTAGDVQAYTGSSGLTPWEQKVAGISGGSVTSVAMTVPTDILAVAGTPVTTTGTLAVTKANQTANYVFAGPTSGGAAAPTFRALVAADVPSGTGTVDQTGTAGETLAALDYCYLNTADNKWYKIDIDATATVKVGAFRGFATAGIASAATGTIRTLGVLTGFTGLTAGAYVYATTTAGGYTQTRPTLSGGGTQRALIIAGFAISTTALYIQPTPVQFQIRNTVSAGSTLTVEHYSDTAARLRKLTAYTSVSSGSTLTSNSSATQDQDQGLRAGTGGSLTVASSSDGSLEIGNNGGSHRAASQSFSPTAGGHLTQFTVTLGANTGSPSGTATWYIRTGNAGTSGTTLATGTFTPTASATNTINVSSGPMLDTATTYYLSIKSTSNQSSNNYWTWTALSSNPYASGTAYVSTDDGATFSTSARDMRCVITTTPYDRIAQSFQIGSTSTCDYVAMYLKKVGTPTGTMTLRIETNSGSAPSGTLADANATITVAESGLSTSYSNVTFNFTDFSLTGTTTYWLVLSTDRSASDSNYVLWGVDASSPAYASGNLSTYASAAYTADTGRDAVFSVEGPSTSYESVLDVDYWGSSQAVILNRYDDGSGANGDTKSTIKNNTAGAIDTTIVVELP